VLHPFFESARPLVFAHRGGSALRPENTIVAFDNGLALGADGIELDVHLSRDGRVVVHHDSTLDRTTNANGPLGALTADELAGVDAGYWFTDGVTFPFRGRGVGVPTLATVLHRYRGCRVVIEVKVNSRAMAAALVDVIRRADAVERVCVGSFGLRVLSAVRRMEPSIPTSAAREEVRWALYRSWCRWPVARAPYSGYQVPETSGTTRVVSPRFIEHAHRAGLGVQVWTVDAESDARRLMTWGVDGIITDRPDVMVSVIRK
jgi:glycerophosphoryl diester phosphodiesterase